jgi:hypothetical protein
MSMTRKDFETLADSICTIMDTHCRLQAAVAVVSACVKLNPRFDTQKFFEACNVGVSTSRVYHLPKE